MGRYGRHQSRYGIDLRRTQRRSMAAPSAVAAVLHEAAAPPLAGPQGCARCGWAFLSQPPRGFRPGAPIALVRLPNAVVQRHLRPAEIGRTTLALRMEDGVLADVEVPLRPCAPGAA